MKKRKKSIFNPPVSAVIPTFKGRHLLEQYVPAVLAALRDGDELVVVEDTGPDDTVSWMIQTFDLAKTTPSFIGVDVYRGKYTRGKKTIDVVLLYNQSNQRFGETSNRGVRIAKHPLIFLINSDVAPRKNVLQYLLPYFQDDAVFAVGPLEIEHGKKVRKK